PRARLEEVAKHYAHFGGKSPINDQCRELIAALTDAFKRTEIRLPIYWGNRNSQPWLRDSVQQMSEQGVKRALAFVPSAFGSYSSCRQYALDIASAREDVGEAAPIIDKLPPFCAEPRFIQAWVERVQQALGDDDPASVTAIFSAHSIPLSM